MHPLRGKISFISLLSNLKRLPRSLWFALPRCGSVAEDVHGQSASGEDLVVEAANIEVVAELVFGVGAEFQDFQLSDFVAQRLLVGFETLIQIPQQFSVVM